MVDRYAELYRSFRWQVPERYNIAQACCGQWAAERSRFALYWEDESGATAAYSFWDIQVAANRARDRLHRHFPDGRDRPAAVAPLRARCPRVPDESRRGFGRHRRAHHD